MKNKYPLLAVLGPTASGKSSLSVELALKFLGEIVSCDSMQVYKKMDIGTAKITKDEMKNVPHFMLDIVDYGENFSAADYVLGASEAISKIHAKDKLPILTGGTGLYARSLLYDVKFSDSSKNEKLRVELKNRYENGEALVLFEELKELDEKACENIHVNNSVRLIRALEYCLVTGEKFSQQSPREDREKKYNFLMLCLAFRDRKKLYERINRRVDIMIEQGLISEAQMFYNDKELRAKTSMQAIGYKELFAYFDGKVSFLDAVENIKRESRRYAKRQMTWFKKEEDIHFIYVDDFNSFDELFKYAQDKCEKFLEDKSYE